MPTKEKRSLLIVGSGGQGKMVLDCALATQKYDSVSFVTNDESAPGDISGYHVIQQGDEGLDSIVKSFDDVFIAIGDNQSRESIYKKLKELNASIPSLIHPSSHISNFTEIGEGTIVMPNASINAFSKVGSGCIINTGAIVEHECIVGDFSHLSPSASMGGGTQLGKRVWMCISSCTKDHVKVASDITIGANSCLLADASISGTYVGTPARVIHN